MRFYTLHVPTIEPGSVLPDESRLFHQMAGIVPIKEGFCWPAFFFSLLWSLWHRLWLIALGLFAAKLVISFLVFQNGVDQAVTIVISFSISLLLGFTGNDFRRAKLECRGLKERDIFWIARLRAPRKGIWRPGQEAEPWHLLSRSSTTGREPAVSRQGHREGRR